MGLAHSLNCFWSPSYPVYALRKRHPMKSILIVNCWLWCCLAVLSAQTNPQATESLTYRALGTGQTTGHIADLIINNRLPEEFIASEQWCFIPALNGFQSYVARIPAGITIPGQGMATIPMIGYCTDISTPPVPAGQTMPPVTDWVPVATPGNPNTEGLSSSVQRLLLTAPLPSFQAEQAGFLRTLPAFKPAKSPAKNMPELLYPGTDLPLGGTYAVNQQPRAVAPMIVAAVQLIEKVVESRQANHQFATPFSSDPLQEREAIVQQTVWIMMAALVGETYTQEDFTKKIYAQYERNTGTTATNLPAPQKEQLTDGVAVFWRTFNATGIFANVFR